MHTATRAHTVSGGSRAREQIDVFCFQGRNIANLPTHRLVFSVTRQYDLNIKRLTAQRNGQIELDRSTGGSFGLINNIAGRIEVGLRAKLIEHTVYTHNIVGVAYAERTGCVAIRIGLNQRLGKVAPFDLRTLPHNGEWKPSETKQQHA